MTIYKVVMGFMSLFESCPTATIVLGQEYSYWWMHVLVMISIKYYLREQVEHYHKLWCTLFKWIFLALNLNSNFHFDHHDYTFLFAEVEEEILSKNDVSNDESSVALSTIIS